MKTGRSREPTMVIGHRGASFLSGPNGSIPAFAHCAGVGVDMVELDVRRTRDNVFVVHHDESVSGRPLRTLTYCEAVKLARDDRGLARLPDIIAVLRGHVGIDLEVKESGYEESLMRAVLCLLDTSEFVVTSFLDDTVETVKNLRPTIRAGLLVRAGQRLGQGQAQSPERITFSRSLACRADFIAVHHRLATTNVLSKAASRKLRVWTWTVNEGPMLSRHLCDPRIEAVITDRPELALEIREHAAHSR
jgi:glycerophosphoryl diester phosphodiesterase